jgi:hypothetical protein
VLAGLLKERHGNSILAPRQDIRRRRAAILAPNSRSSIATPERCGKTSHSFGQQAARRKGKWVAETVVQSRDFSSSLRESATRSLRSVRPSLLDLRFTGDPWLIPDEEGTAALCLDDYRLLSVALLPFDVPSFNRAVLTLRQNRTPRYRRPGRSAAWAG